MNGRGLNVFKPRSSLGKFLDSIGKSQEWLREITGMNKSTISVLCNDPDSDPREVTQLKVVSALRKRGYNVSTTDFW